MLVAAIRSYRLPSASARPTRKTGFSSLTERTWTAGTAKITGYAPGENFGNTFRVENGHLKVAYDAYDEFRERFGHIFYKDKFSHYIIAVEYRFLGDQAKNGPNWAIRNSGIMIDGQVPQTMLKDQDFPISIEVQLLGGNGTTPRTS